MSEMPYRTKELPRLPERPDQLHKGDAGRVVVIAGSWHKGVAMPGAAGLVANAAFRSGAGLVQIWAASPLILSIATLSPCSTFRELPDSCDDIMSHLDTLVPDAVVIGPGLGISMKPADIRRIVSHCPYPMVIDADALNRLAEAPDGVPKLTDKAIITPHPGEAVRLLQALPSSVHHLIEPLARNTADDAARLEAAMALVEHLQCVVVLKGHRTVVAERERYYINETGNAGMATAGAGDVLAGVVAALLASGLSAFEAGILGVYLHGLAGDFAAEERGRLSLMATDLIEFLSESFADYESTLFD